MPTQFETTAGTGGMARYAALPLRAIAGYGMMEHGWAKINRGPEVFAATLQALHVPMPHVAAYLTIAVELLTGFAFLLGAFVAWASLPAVVVLLTAMFTVHLPYGFSAVKLKAIVNGQPQFGPPGYETILFYVAAIVALLLLGPSLFSVDRYRLRGRGEDAASAFSG